MSDFSNEAIAATEQYMAGALSGVDTNRLAGLTLTGWMQRQPSAFAMWQGVTDDRHWGDVDCRDDWVLAHV